MNSPEISVIIPSYNRGKLLPLALESVLSQTYNNYEVIVIDDGSEDNTQEQLVPYYQKIHYLFQKNSGKSRALNRGLKEAKGNWIAILDSDDIWLPDKLDLQMKVVQEYGKEVGLVFTDAFYIGDPSLPETVFSNAQKDFPSEVGIIHNPIHYVLHPLHGIYEQCSLIKRELLNQIGGFDENLKVAEDTDMIFRMSMATQFAYINKPLVKIDRTPDRESGLLKIFQQRQEKRVSETHYMYHKWLSLAENLDEEYREIILKRLSEVYNSWATLHVKKRQYKEASQCMSKAITIKPSPWMKLKHRVIDFAPFLANRIYQWRTFNT